MFYGSVEDFMDAFDFKEALDRVVIDVSRGALSAYILVCTALDMRSQIRRDGAEVEVVDETRRQETIVDQAWAIMDKAGVRLDKRLAHWEDYYRHRKS